MAKFYITNSIPYVNAEPHIGHALEFIQSDAVARYNTIIGNDVLYLCGADENAVKNVQAAEKKGVSVQELVDTNALLFQKLASALNIHFDVFQKGSDPKHHASSQKLWELCEKAGDIYKKSYKGLYCVGCEAFYTKSELDENGECFEHPGKKLEEVEEENYFFRLSKYQKRLVELIESGEFAIVPQFRKNEILSFLKGGLDDFSISRSNERAKNWGVPVPNDPTQRIYVWFDALNIYQSGIGFGTDERSDEVRLQGGAEDKRGSSDNSKRHLTEKDYRYWWPADLHVIGKGIIRFHAVYWPAILLSAGLELPKKLFVHEYFTVNGQKMSKTLGNVIDPTPLATQYGADALRYYCLAKISPFSDGDFSVDKFTEAYNSDLANGLGNLIARVAKLCETGHYKQLVGKAKVASHLLDVQDYTNALNEYRFNDALKYVWEKIARLDKFINTEKPWELVKNNDSKIKGVLSHAVDQIQEIAALLEPFLPETAKRIKEQFKGPKIVSQKPLFPRIV